MVSEVTHSAALQSPAAASLPRTATAEGQAKVSVPKPSPVQHDHAQSLRELAQAIDDLNRQMQSQKTGLGFSMDHSLQSPVVVVTNTASGEVVRKIPSMDVLARAHSIDAMKGLLLNARA